MKVGAFNDDAKALIYARAKGRCEMCGTRAEGVHLHHRQPRQMGGTSLPSVGGADNGLFLHPRCHDIIESNRSTAYLNGWLVKKSDAPESVPVKLWDGWHYLHPDGSVSRTGQGNLTGQHDGGASAGAASC